jgi:hypothetical protein
VSVAHILSEADAIHGPRDLDVGQHREDVLMPIKDADRFVA